eukprot:gene2739-12611_t
MQRAKGQEARHVMLARAVIRYVDSCNFIFVTMYFMQRAKGQEALPVVLARAVFCTWFMYLRFWQMKVRRLQTAQETTAGGPEREGPMGAPQTPPHSENQTPSLVTPQPKKAPKENPPIPAGPPLK